MESESFPRGGKKFEAKRSSKVFHDKKSNKKRETRVRKRNDSIIVEDTNLIANTAERLSNATLWEGMIILGRISKITEYELIVSIPGGLLGRVQVADLSESYANLLQNIINSESIESTEFKSLPDLYNIGEYVVCYVKSVNPEGTWVYNLSLEPQLINQNIDNNFLRKDTKIVCTIKSIEEHGYTVDTGIANVRAFIASKDIDKEQQYFPGNQISCVIKEIKTIDHTSVVTLSAKKKKVDNIIAHNIEFLDTLVPGTKLHLCVKKVLSNGLQVIFGKDNIGYINQIYLNSPLSMYESNTEVTGTLLYIMPTVKLAYFSLLTEASEKEKLNVGDIIKKAKVLYRESKGVVFKLSKSGLHGFISLRRTNVPVAKIPTVFEQNSIHKCRILSYNWMEHIYVCTMESEILEQKYFSPSDLNMGDILMVQVTNIDTKSGFVRVQAGKIHGVVAPEHISDKGLSILNKLQVADSVEARVLDIDDKCNIRFTLKQSLIKSVLPVLKNIQEARRGLQCHGTITKISRNGLLVRFYGDVKGWVPRTVLNNDTSDMNWNYSMGQTVKVSIVSIEKDEGKMKLRIVTEEEKQRSINMSIGELIEGTVAESSVEGIYLRIHKTDEDIVTGFLPAGHMAPCMEIGRLLASKCTPGDIISAFVFATEPSIILSRTYVTQEEYRNFDALKIDDCIPCTIRDILQEGVRVILPIKNYSTFGFVSYKNISNFEQLQINQILFVKITAINTREKRLSLTMALKSVWESPLNHGVKMLSAADALSLYLNKSSELAANPFYKNKPIFSMKLGEKVTGNIEKVTPHGLVLRLDNNLMGIVRKEHYSKDFKVGDKVFGTIMWKNHVHDLVDVSLLPRIVNGISSKQKLLPQLPSAGVLRGEILMITDWLILVVIKYHGVGYLAALPVRRHINDIRPDLTPYVIHAKIRLYVVLKGNECDIVPICMLKSAFETPRKAIATQPTPSKNKMKRISQQQDAASVMVKKSKIKDANEKINDDYVGKNETFGSNSNNVTVKNEMSYPVKDESIKQSNRSKAKQKREECESNAKKKNKKEDEMSDGKNRNYEDNEVKDIDEISKSDESSSDENEEMDDNLLFTEKSHVPECGFSWDDKSNVNVIANAESSSDDEEELTEEPKRKKKKLNAAERREQERQKEREIRQREEALASNQVPNSIDQFDRLVLSSPDSSLVWLQYMAYHLQATEIDKARVVAKRAIKTINFREENERLNIWNSWLNLESRFGTSESLNDVFREAVKVNDPLKIYTHMLTVHMDASRQIELEKLIGTMLGKFKQDPQIWIDCGAALLKIGLKEKSRHIMQRALQSLPSSQHVNLMVRFANLENKLGDKERSQTLFEQILTSYPKRIDIWSSYVDCLIKSEDIDIARRVLERAVAQTLPTRKMKTLFKKFMEFENKHGTSETMARVQQMAADYVENATKN